MDGLAKSMLRLPWAVSLFSIQQMANLVSPADGKQPTRETEASLYSVVQTTQRQFNDLLFAAFQIGDGIQNGMVDLASDMLTLRAFAPSYLSALGSSMTRQSTETLRVLTPGRDSQLAWQQLKNTYEVFNLVKHVRDLLRIPSEGEFHLKELVERAYELGEYPDLWAVEGLGHDYAEHFWGREPVRNILTDEKASALPAKSLTMMHAGIGLLFAQRLVETISPYSPPSKVGDVLREFKALCDQNSRKGYVGAAYESLGLLTRTWHPQMVPIVHQQLSEVAPDLLGYYWHGAGRALCFSPLFIVPGTLSPWRAVDSEPPDEASRMSARAGLTWAYTLVNIRHPEVMENVVRHHGDQFTQDDSFSNGVSSSLIMSWDITPDESFITKFLEHEPDASDQHAVELWSKLVKRPAEEAVRSYHRVLQEHERLEEVFRYQDLGKLVDQLEREPKSSSAVAVA